MNIGILLCGNVPAKLIKEFGSYSECLKTHYRLDSYGSVKTWNVYQHNEFPKFINECDVYIIGGSPSGVNDNLNWVKDLTTFIQSAFRAKRKLFGICFGHQVINYALGGKVEETKRGWGLGAYDVLLQQNIDELTSGQKMKLIAIHQDQVISTGTGFEVLAGSEFCPHYMTKYQDRVLTVQGHPEFTAAFFNALLSQRIDIFQQDEIEAATITEAIKIDSLAFNRFVTDFLFAK